MNSCCIRVFFFSLFFKFPIVCYIISVRKHYKLRKNSRLTKPSWLYNSSNKCAQRRHSTQIKRMLMERLPGVLGGAWEMQPISSASRFPTAPLSLETGSSRGPLPCGTKIPTKARWWTLDFYTFISLVCLADLRALLESALICFYGEEKWDSHTSTKMTTKMVTSLAKAAIVGDRAVCNPQAQGRAGTSLLYFTYSILFS